MDCLAAVLAKTVAADRQVKSLGHGPFPSRTRVPPPV